MTNIDIFSLYKVELVNIQQTQSSSIFLNLLKTSEKCVKKERCAASALLGNTEFFVKFTTERK